ncbi:MAG: DNA internalization-related competence protein ComEC/Rec2, partial [Ignavibacteriales bacterium]|nr:DNA internalization-related competence protein ComEC/Rec2 [Ignavibacteriales bacterium]
CYHHWRAPDAAYPFDDPVIRDVRVRAEIEALELPREGEIVARVAVGLVDSTTSAFDARLSIKSDSPKRLAELYERLAPGVTLLLAEATIRRPPNRRNPGEFDYREYLRRKNVAALVYERDVETIDVVGESRRFPRALLFEARSAVARKLAALFEGETLGVLRALLLADRSATSDETREAFSASGAAHVLAVSGLHVGLVFAVASILFGWAPRRRRTWLVVGSLLSFLALTGAPASAFRATTTAIVATFLLHSERERDPYNALAFAAFLILLVDPNDVFAIGFQLSFVSALGILLALGPAERMRIRLGVESRVAKYLYWMAAVSFAAQAATAPIVAHYFERISAIGLAVNVVVVPAVFLIAVGGALASAASLVSAFVAGVFASATDVLAEGLVLLVGAASELSFASFGAYWWSGYDVALYYAAFVAAMALLPKMRRFATRAAFLLALVGTFLLWSRFDDEPLLAPNRLTVAMIDVGQGDAFLVAFPEGTTALIDAGPAWAFSDYDAGERTILPLLDRLGVERIDYGIVSHMDLDHYGGFLALFEAGRVKTVLKAAPDAGNETDVAFEAAAREAGVRIARIEPGAREIGGARLTFLNDPELPVVASANRNNRSATLAIDYGETRALFMGDGERLLEAWLVWRYGEALDCDVLKAGHHGASAASGGRLLRTTTPSLALISAGEGNRYGHPAPDALARLRRSGARLIRTDKSGAAILRSDGERFRLVSWRDRGWF